eukprot:2123725-Rhodomonas_salina.2
MSGAEPRALVLRVSGHCCCASTAHVRSVLSTSGAEVPGGAGPGQAEGRLAGLHQARALPAGVRASPLQRSQFQSNGKVTVAIIVAVLGPQVLGEALLPVAALHSKGRIPSFSYQMQSSAGSVQFVRGSVQCV